MEEEIRNLPSLDGSGDVVINIHIEPLGTQIANVDLASGEMSELAREVEGFINGLAGEFPALADCHEVHVRRVEHKTLVSCHCTMDGRLPITEIHDVTALLEDRVREKFPQIARVTIHPEPPESR